MALVRKITHRKKIDEIDIVHVNINMLHIDINFSYILYPRPV